MNPARRCSRTACGAAATATLTYVYADQTAVLGPLATYAEPHAYDLCDDHARALSAPRGWEVLRLAADPAAGGPSEDDLLALADAVREAARPPARPTPGPTAGLTAGPGQPAQPGPDDEEAGARARHPSRRGSPAPEREAGRRGHLRVLSSD